jgi:hypothetical protein
LVPATGATVTAMATAAGEPLAAETPAEDSYDSFPLA